MTQNNHFKVVDEVELVIKAIVRVEVAMNFLAHVASQNFMTWELVFTMQTK